MQHSLIKHCNLVWREDAELYTYCFTTCFLHHMHSVIGKIVNVIGYSKNILLFNSFTFLLEGDAC